MFTHTELSVNSDPTFSMVLIQLTTGLRAHFHEWALLRNESEELGAQSTHTSVQLGYKIRFRQHLPHLVLDICYNDSQGPKKTLPLLLSMHNKIYNPGIAKWERYVGQGVGEGDMWNFQVLFGGVNLPASLCVHQHRSSPHPII